MAIDDFEKKRIFFDLYKEKLFFLNNTKDIYNDQSKWKLPDNPPYIPEQPPEAEPAPTGPQLPREQVLKSLDSVFIDDVLKDDIVTRTAIPDLLEGQEPAYTGVILFGPPGTGKTVLLEAIADVYKASGAYAKEISVTSITSKWVGEFAQNLETEIKKTLQEAEKRGKPSFIFFDEGSILAQNATEGSTSVSKHYQEAIDVLKRYVGNNRNLVVAISTNLLSESFEDALTREGRLTTYFIGHPDEEQRKRMWKYFIKEKGVLSLTDEQAYQLGRVTPAEQGAFIEEFARNYKRARRTAILKERGYTSLVDALKHNANVSEQDVTNSITFENLYADLVTTLKAKYDRVNGDKDKPKSIGFNEE
jgi:SpoVK/Ycf46/Vps4 family AAA+-type ATPase